MPSVVYFTVTIDTPESTSNNSSYIHLFTTDNDSDYQCTALKAGRNQLVWSVTLGAHHQDQRLPRTELALVVLLRQVVQNDNHQEYLNTEGMARVPFSAFKDESPFQRTIFHRGSVKEYSAGRTAVWTFEVAVRNQQLLRDYSQEIRAKHPLTANDLETVAVNTLVNKRVSDDYNFDYTSEIGRRVPSFPAVGRTMYPCYYIPEYVAPGWVLYQGSGNQFTAPGNLNFVKTVINAAAIATVGYTFTTKADTFALDVIKRRVYDTKLQIEFLTRVLSLVPNFCIYATDKGSVNFSWDEKERNNYRQVYESADGLLASAGYSHPAGDCEDMTQAILGMHTALCTSAELDKLIPLTCEFARMYNISAALVLMRQGMAPGWSHMTSHLVPRENAEGYDRTPLWPLIVDGIYPFLSIFSTHPEIVPHEAITACVSQIMHDTKTLAGQWTGSPVASMEKGEFTHLTTSDQQVVFIRTFKDLLGGFQATDDADTDSDNEHGMISKGSYRKVSQIPTDAAFTESIAHKVGDVHYVGVDTSEITADPASISYKTDTIAKSPHALAMAGMARFRHPNVIIPLPECMIIPGDIIELGMKDVTYTTGPGSLDHVIVIYVDHQGIRERLNKIYNPTTFETLKKNKGVYYIQVVPISISKYMKAWIARLEFRAIPTRVTFDITL